MNAGRTCGHCGAESTHELSSLLEDVAKGLELANAEQRSYWDSLSVWGKLGEFWGDAPWYVRVHAVLSIVLVFGVIPALLVWMVIE